MITYVITMYMFLIIGAFIAIFADEKYLWYSMTLMGIAIFMAIIFPIFGVIGGYHDFDGFDNTIITYFILTN